ncbi:SDR family oxidoreductase [Billgrantia gudaonensis]|uniref:SDR family oxidoreductase n=1 Tax=Billgrantia gudaonensis TaxID=376427 RepID=A0A3S0NWT3_9GAMM|nr:SDR family oxidoreductase [Halomonas gudaonensis]
MAPSDEASDLTSTSTPGTLFTAAAARRHNQSIPRPVQPSGRALWFAQRAYLAQVIRNFARSQPGPERDRHPRKRSFPGATETPGLKGLANAGEEDALLEGFASQIPLGRIGHPEETAALALFLALDESSFPHRYEVFADGGAALSLDGLLEC